MICIFNGIHKNTFNAGLDTVLVALAFEEPVELVLIVDDDSQGNELNEKLLMLKQAGLKQIFTVTSPNCLLNIPLETKAISALELRTMTLKHQKVLSF